ncbi:MAG: hypothetical protein HY909_08640 [Deltaproteobacteria bacterium]|nr:hypothetical protein [Deltaproteobacteria bacterium]
MASVEHETVVAMLRAHPEHLAALVALQSGQVALPATLALDDSVLRGAEAAEVRPDAVYLAPDGAWVVLEVQRAQDPAKARRWPLMAALLLDRRGVLGELLVLTTQPHVAAWAQEVAVHRSPAGCMLAMVPVVVLLAGELLGRLLDPRAPALAFYAAWAVKDKDTLDARLTVWNALELTRELPAELRAAQARAILRVLSDATLAWLKDTLMTLDDIPDGPALRAWTLELETKGIEKGLARGKAEAVLAVLSARGLAATEPQVAAVLGCRDAAVLDAWLRAVASVPSVDALLASAP